MTSTRDVQLSMFPDRVAEKPQGWIMPSVFVGSNADLIAAVAPLYLGGGMVLDTTYGKGGWWTKFRPSQFVMHDMDPDKGDGVDFTALPEPDDTYGAVTFDPPYVPAGSLSTSTERKFRDAYGLSDTYTNGADVRATFRAGMAECARVLRPGGWLLVKCCDFVNSRQFTVGLRNVLDAADELQLRDWDLIVHHSGPGPTSNQIWTPVRSRRHHSYLVVLRKRVRKAFPS